MNDVNQTPHPIAKKDYVKPLLYSIITLVSGVIIGAAATALILQKSDKPARPDGLEYITKRTVNRMVRELSLTPEQKEQIFPIVKEHFEEIDKIRKEARPQIREEIEEMNESLLAVFDDHQKMLWQDCVQRMKKHFPRMHQRRGPGGQRQRGPDQEPRRPGQDQWGPGPGARNGNRQGMDRGDFRRGEQQRRRLSRDPNQPPLPGGPLPLNPEQLHGPPTEDPIFPPERPQESADRPPLQPL